MVLLTYKRLLEGDLPVKSAIYLLHFLPSNIIKEQKAIPKILLGTLRRDFFPSTGSTRPKPVPYLVKNKSRNFLRKKNYKTSHICTANCLLYNELSIHALFTHSQHMLVLTSQYALAATHCRFEQCFIRLFIPISNNDKIKIP